MHKGVKQIHEKKKKEKERNTFGYFIKLFPTLNPNNAKN